MEQYNLTAKEFIYLSLSAGAKRVYGVEDEFGKVRRENLSEEFVSVQKELMKKSYMRFDFDGNATIKKKLLEEMKICASCEHVVTFTASGTSGSKKMNFYIQGNEMVSLVQNEEGFILQHGETEDVLKKVKTAMTFSDTADAGENVAISVNQKDVLKVFKEQNIRKNNFYSILSIKKREESKMTNLIYLDTNLGILAVKNKIVALENVLEIKKCTFEDVEKTLEMVLRYN